LISVDDIANQARELRVAGLSVAAIQARLGVSKHSLTTWLAGIPAPGWTRRPNAKDDLRARSVELRAEGWSVNDIALELGVARSTAWSWVRHMPLDRDSERARKKAAHSKLMTDARWERHRDARDAAAAAAHAEAAALVGDLSERDLMLIGAVAYWCEGAKSKPWRRNERLKFTNSDPVLIKIFLGFLAASGAPIDRVTYRVSIHETSDADAAADWWRQQLGLAGTAFLPPVIKRHKPMTNRRNVGVGYHGCLVVEVGRSRAAYWQIEGIIKALGRCV
jgi:transposase